MGSRSGPTRVAGDADDSMMVAMRRIALLAALFLTGCSWWIAPVLPPVAPPPNVPLEVLLFTVPQSYVDGTRSDVVQTHFISELTSLEQSHPQRVAQIRAHQVFTGMTPQHVIWTFVSQPYQIEDQGPPGGHTLLWGQGPPFESGRYWVRFDEWGLAVEAGRY